MMKKATLFLAVLLVFSNILFAKTSKYFNYSGNDGEDTVIKFKLGEVNIAQSGSFTKLQIPKVGTTSEVGMPEFPILSTFYQIEPDKSYSVDYTVIRSHKIQNIKIFPYQDTENKSETPDVKIINEAFYNSNREFPQNNLIVSEPKIMRGIQLLNVSFIPFIYSARTQELEIYDEVEISIQETGSRENPNFKQMSRSRAFDKLYEGLVINYTSSDSTDDYQQPAILYICGGSSETNPYFQQLVEWRHQRGYVVYTASTSITGGSASQIKSYILNAYNTFDPPPEFVGLVGDVTGSYSIPTYYFSYGEGDAPYSQLVGIDLLPEVLVGRLSVQSTTHLSTVVSKIKHYEKATYFNTIQEYYEKAALVGDPSSSGISTVISNEYIVEIMEVYGMDDIRTNFGHGNYENWMDNQLNEGVLYFNYRGYWGVSGFGTGNVNNLNNGFKLCFATVLTCGTGDFEDYTCLSEAFFRYGTASNPKGAIAAVGTSTLSTHTAYNNIVAMGMYDGIFPKQLESAGAALANGKLSLYLTYYSTQYQGVQRFTHWNNLMGDPATHLWTDTPIDLLVIYPSEIPFGTNYIDVEVMDVFGNSVENAMVTLLKDNDEIFISGYTNESGKTTIPLDYYSGGEIFVTATKQNYIPHQGSFFIITDGALINVDHQLPINVIDNDDGILNPGETVGLSIPLKNYGLDIVSGIEATLTSTSDLVTILIPTISYGTIAPGHSEYGDMFALHLLPSAINGEDLGLRLNIVDDSSNVWSAVIYIDVLGSYLMVESYTIEGGGIINPGETKNISISLKNFGSIAANGVFAELSANTEALEFPDSIGNWGNILSGQIIESTDNFTVFAHDAIINGTMFPIELHIQNGDGYDRTEYFHIQVGEVSVTDPLGPDNYGYYIYDSGDIDYNRAPVYDWIEINPSYGGSGSSLNMIDYGYGNPQSQQSAHIYLQNPFRFYGVDYDEITVSTNGWIAFGFSLLESFRNYPVPGAGGPSPMVAAFWDDLKTTGGGNVYYYVDTAEGYIVIEWSDMRTYANNSLESFQIILYNDPVLPYGDHEIKIQYKTFNNTSLGDYYNPGAYSTVGIENHLSNDGLQYTFSNDYPTAAMLLDDSTALLITTYPTIDTATPALSYAPEFINFYLQPDQTTNNILSISNNGDVGSILNYDISEEYSPFENPGGGPDELGYYWSDSDLEQAIDYEWFDISGMGTQLSFPQNDTGIDSIDIGFDFPFYGEVYSQCIINPNGWIGFGDDNNEWQNISIPSSSAPRPAILGFWDDLDPLQGGDVFYYNDSERFIVWFDNVIHYPGTYNGTYDFQMVLYPNGDIQVNYRQMTEDITSATIGIQNSDGNTGLEVVFNNNYIHDNLSLHFRQPPSQWLTIPHQNRTLQGELHYGESATFIVEVNSSGLPIGLYTGSIKISSNAQPPVIIPVILSVLSNGNQISISFKHNKHWNMIGLPLIVEDNSCETLFRNFEDGTLYSYNGNYVQEDCLIIGNGYWLKFINSGISTIIGLPISDLTINLSEGWNMFSGISYPVNVFNIQDPDSIIISNTLYGYDNGYVIPTQIEPGRGYWVRASAAGDITLSVTRKMVSTIKFVDRTINANTITFTNEEGGTNTLYFGVDVPEDERLNYSLPPVPPPAGGFDVRFAGNLNIAEESGIIEVSNSPMPLTISYDISNKDNEENYWVLVNKATGEEYVLEGSGDIKVTGNIEGFELNKYSLSVESDISDLPTEFMLYPSYPNPFNPNTTIKYAVPDPSKVRISVFDILGREVTELCNENKQPGYHKVVWNASRYASGIYFIQMIASQDNDKRAGNYVKTFKISLIK